MKYKREASGCECNLKYCKPDCKNDHECETKIKYVIDNTAYDFFSFGFSFTSLSSFFTHIETNQSVGGAKTGVPGEKPPDTPASRTWLVSHMNSCEPTSVR